MRRYKFNRRFDQLTEIEQLIRRALPENVNGDQLTITFFSGFEIFGHYETWGSGWRVEGYGVKVKSEYLNDAVEDWIEKHKAQQP